MRNLRFAAASSDCVSHSTRLRLCCAINIISVSSQKKMPARHKSVVSEDNLLLTVPGRHIGESSPTSAPLLPVSN